MGQALVNAAGLLSHLLAVEYLSHFQQTHFKQGYPKQNVCTLILIHI